MVTLPPCYLLDTHPDREIRTGVGSDIAWSRYLSSHSHSCHSLYQALGLCRVDELETNQEENWQSPVVERALGMQ